MISIHGTPNTDEYRAAGKLQRLIIKAWPSIVSSQNDNVWIICDVHCYGQDPEQLDIVVFVKLSEPRVIYKGTSGERDIQAQYFCLVIEYKLLGLGSMEVEGRNLRVFYPNKDYLVDGISHAQTFSLKNYLEARPRSFQPPVIFNFVWFDSLLHDDIPLKLPIFLGSDFTWNHLLERISSDRHVKSTVGSKWGAFKPGDIDNIVEYLTRKIKPTLLDLKRIDEITRETVLQEEYLDAIGKKMLILRGHGGTGKTIAMLQLAYQRYRERNDRMLIISYNRALIADIRRAVRLIAVQEEFLADGLRITSAYSFFGQLLRALEVYSGHISGEKFLKQYENFKQSALDMIVGGAITGDDISAIIQRNRKQFDWDFILIDEAQDWPENERDLLYHIYGHQKLVVADGIDQLIRRHKSTNWRKILPRNEVEVIPMKYSLRLTYNLAVFLQHLASYMSIEWDLVPNKQLQGGRVIVVEGSYTADVQLHDKLVQDLRSAGHQPINMLFCVPPDPTRKRPRRYAAWSALSEWLAQHGEKAWDGTVPQVRENTYPVDPAEFRIVQYESARGLEGWTVVLLGFDEFASYKSARFEANPNLQSQDSEKEHLDYIARWLMIPLTRAIDTLVIEIKSPNHPVSRALRTVAAANPTFVSWHDVAENAK